MGVTFPVYLLISERTDPEKIIIRHFLGEKTLENGDFLELKIVVDSDGRIVTDISYD